MPQSRAVPSSRPPAPPSGRGAFYYILAIVVLSGAIGSLIYWRLRPPPPPEVPLPAVSAPVQAPVFAEPPPPPPPLEEDAGQVENRNTRVEAPGYNPCAGTCRGTASPALQAALSARAGAARPCYERALRVNAALTGRLTVGLRVDPGGLVCSTSIMHDAIHSAEVASCVMGMFRSSRFPAPTGGCVDVNVPLSFVPKEGK